MFTVKLTRCRRRTMGYGTIHFTGFLLLLLSMSANAANPSPPGDLRYKVYSRTAAEVFWNRATDDGHVVAYEIKVDGRVIGNRDALSYYTNTLVAGKSYTVVVTSIDNQANRSVPASVNFVAGGTTVTPPPVTPPPVTPPSGNVVAAPTGLKASVYSSTSAEIMWTRPATFGLRYEVSRNGSVVTTTTGVSYYNQNLTPATTYTYRLVAIAPNGNRSSASTISLNTSVGTVTPPPVTPPPVTPPPVTPPSGNVVAAPTGLKGSVYSSTSAEIMWTRPATSGLRYEVSRNGSVVTTTTGVSFFDPNLAAGTTYTYQVIAINGSGRRSSPSSVMLNTQGGIVGGGGGGSGGGGGPVNPGVSASIREPADVYRRDGYGSANVIRLNVRTVTTRGTCTVADQSGCTLADVLADVNKNDALTVDIPIHVSGDDFPNDGSVSNAELRLRGGGSRLAPQKSFRIKLDSKQDLWRNERYFQLNKHPYDGSRIRNKLATDVMSVIPNLPSLRTQFVNLWIDDGRGPVDYGLFTHVERVNDNYLLNRGWNKDGNVYKAEDFRFDKGDLSDILVDQNGEPLNESRFETSLEIENGKDHRALQSMMQDLNNPSRTFESVLDQYFDRANVLAWVATNFMVRQSDAVRHNYILYNPAGTRKFYFLPWDYDEAMGVWNEPPRDLSNDSLRQRSEYGYGLAARNIFLEGYYRLPGIHNKILQAVESIRQNYVTDQFMTGKVNSHFNLVAPFEQRLPDRANNPHFNVGSAGKFIGGPGTNTETIRTRFRVPIGPILDQPQKQGSTWLFSARPAFDPTGTSGAISYRLQIARTPTFDSNTIVVDVSGIPNSSRVVTRNVDAARLSTGDYYARLIAIPSNEPERFFQVSGNKLYQDGKTFYGAIRFRAQ